MALNTAALNIGAGAIRGAITHLAIHTAAPDPTTGTNQSAAARQAVTWTAAANGDFNLTAAVHFTGGAASGPAMYVGYWSAATGGTFYGSKPLTGDQTFNAAGQYTVSALAINGDSA